VREKKTDLSNCSTIVHNIHRKRHVYIQTLLGLMLQHVNESVLLISHNLVLGLVSLQTASTTTLSLIVLRYTEISIIIPISTDCYSFYRTIFW